MPASPTQLKIARAQLGAALSLFLRDKDPIAVQALACGGAEVIEKVARLNGVEPISTHIIQQHPTFDLGKLRAERNVYWNAIKHFSGASTREPDRDDEALMARFEDRHNDAVLFLGWWDYLAVTGALPIEAQVFQLWWYALNERALAPGVDKDTIRAAFPKITSVERHEQKRRLNRMIERHRGDKSLLGDPRTEAGRLLASV